MTDERITLETALAALPEGDQIHTFRGGGMLLGADWPRAEVERVMREQPLNILPSGPIADALGHRLALFTGGSWLYIQTKEDFHV